MVTFQGTMGSIDERRKQFSLWTQGLDPRNPLTSGA
jgi:hypothetical protein